MAPYWSDNDIRRDGEVSYEIFQKGRSSYDDMMLDTVNYYLNVNMMSQTNFYGSFMILAEWRGVHSYPHGSYYFYYFIYYYPSLRSFTDQVFYSVYLYICTDIAIILYLVKSIHANKHCLG